MQPTAEPSRAPSLPRPRAGAKRRAWPRGRTRGEAARVGAKHTTTFQQPLRWKGRWFSPVAGGIYDVRARQWSPELGTFLSVDEFDMHSPKTTLWGWPGQNPAQYDDPSGRGWNCSVLPFFPFIVCFNDPDPPRPPTPSNMCPADDHSDCKEDCHDQYDRDAAECKNKGTPKDRERCYREAKNKEARCIADCNKKFPPPGPP